MCDLSIRSKRVIIRGESFNPLKTVRNDQCRKICTFIFAVAFSVLFQMEKIRLLFLWLRTCCFFYIRRFWLHTIHMSFSIWHCFRHPLFSLLKRCTSWIGFGSLNVRGTKNNKYNCGNSTELS